MRMVCTNRSRDNSLLLYDEPKQSNKKLAKRLIECPNGRIGGCEDPVEASKREVGKDLDLSTTSDPRNLPLPLVRPRSIAPSPVFVGTLAWRAAKRVMYIIRRFCSSRPLCMIFWNVGPELFTKMIECLLIVNRQGKVRLNKWYSPLPDQEKRRVISEVHRLATTRDETFTNFVDFVFKFNQHVLVYKRYAGIFVCLLISPEDNHLAALESIQLFIEVLDRYFSGVCELDLVFNFWKVYAIVDEVFLAGEVMETSKKVVWDRIALIDKAHPTSNEHIL